MPELPEVETVRLGLTPIIINKQIQNVTIRQRQLRWKISDDFEANVISQKIAGINRRGKYLLLRLKNQHIMIHLGMSGRLCFLSENKPVEKHDHLDIIFSDNSLIRYTDPRRFGCVLLVEDPLKHPLLSSLGPEPLSEKFTPEYLFSRLQQRKMLIKPLIMQSSIVVGVGNIYASEALFLAKVSPVREAKSLSFAEVTILTQSIKQVLQSAIKQGGTTLKDFVNSEGKPGYFAQQLNVYGKAGKPCFTCNTPLKSLILAQRNTYYCPGCQK